eukprot:tig00000073_g1710.t1
MSATTGGTSAAIAFALTVAAGLATVIGGLVTLLPQALTSRKILAGALALAAGVMLHVSYVEVVTEAGEHFTRAMSEGHPGEGHAELLSTLAVLGSLFGGMGAVAVLDFMINRYMRGPEPDVAEVFDGPPIAIGEKKKPARRSKDLEEGEAVAPRADREGGAAASAAEAEAGGPPPAALQRLSPAVVCPASLELAAPGSQEKEDDVTVAGGGQDAYAPDGSKVVAESEAGGSASARRPPLGAEKEKEQRAAPAPRPEDDIGGLRLLAVAIVTFVSITLHKIPEGIASFLSLAGNLKVGGAVALAIAIHNIPEGISVGITVLQATGSRKKAIFWCFLAGCSEPIGAAIGWGIMDRGMTEAASGIVYGLVGGVMIFTAVVELLPTAFRIRAGDKFTAGAVILGMLIMHISFVLFEL